MKKSKLEIAIEALEHIANPVSKMQDEAKEDGYRLNGMMAVQISNDPNYLKSIAQKALSEIIKPKN